MKKLLVFLSVIFLILGLVNITNAELVVRGYGTIVSGGSGEYQLIYDTDQNITWLDFSKTEGLMTWYDRTAWVESLEVQFRGQIFSDWRLPRVDTSVITALGDGWWGPDQDGNYDYSQGWNMTNSEMGHLSYITLENIGYYATDGTYPQPGWYDPQGLVNTGPFEHFLNAPDRTDWYWSSTDSLSNPDTTYIFYFYRGQQGADHRSAHALAVAVYDGDVASVSEPVSIDIIPKTCPNELPIKGGGSVKVAILGTVDFDVNDIDIASVRLEGVAPTRSSLKDKSSPLVTPPTDCECTTDGRDGFLDLCLKFDKKAIITALSGVTVDIPYPLTLTGELSDGTLIEGTDCITFVKKGKKD